MSSDRSQVARACVVPCGSRKANVVKALRLKQSFDNMSSDKSQVARACIVPCGSRKANVIKAKMNYEI